MFEKTFHLPVSQLALSNECFNFGDPLGFAEVSVHTHVEKLISDPGRFYLNSSIEKSEGGEDTQHAHPPPHDKEDLQTEMHGMSNSYIAIALLHIH